MDVGFLMGCTGESVPNFHYFYERNWLFLGHLGVSRDATSDALKRLEDNGLILVKRSPGQRPTVQILPVAQGVTKRENTG